MPTDGTPHTLVVYGSSSRADQALGELVSAAREEGRRVTVVSLAAEEPNSGCCDTRSVLWNEISADLAREELARASRAVASNDAVEFHRLIYRVRHPADALAGEALARGVDEIVFADPKATALGRRERRRLRRRSAIPVSE
jgi:Universal stress protein family